MGLAQMLVITLCLFLYNHSVAWAGSGFDLSLGSSYRSFPIAGGGDFTLGYGRVLWGSEGSPFMGYTRLAYEVEGVEGYFGHGGYLDIFPVSILGVRVGEKKIQNHISYENYNCESYRCEGYFSSRYIEGQLYFGINNIKFSGSYRKEKWEVDENDNINYSQDSYIEPISGLNLSLLDKEDIERIRYAVFYEVTNNFKLGYIGSNYSAPQDLEGLNNRESLYWLSGLHFNFNKILWPNDELNFFIGGGEYRSHLLTTDPLYILSLTYAPIKKLGY